MHIAEVVTIAKSLPLLRLNTYKSLILSYSADYRRIFRKNRYQFHRKALYPPTKVLKSVTFRTVIRKNHQYSIIKFLTGLMKHKGRKVVFFFKYKIILYTSQEVTSIREKFIKFILCNIPNLPKAQFPWFSQLTFATIVKQNSFLYNICKEILANLQIIVNRIYMFDNELRKSVTTVFKQIMIFVSDTLQFSFYPLDCSVGDDKNIIITLIRGTNTELYSSIP